MIRPSRTALGISLVVVAVLAAFPTTCGGGTAPPGAVCLGYHTGDGRSFEAVQAFARYLTIVSVDVYAVQSDGTITDSDDFGVVAFCKEHGIEVYACVSNYNDDPDVDGFDASLGRAAIVTYRDEVIANLASFAEVGGYDGVNVDLENLAYSADIERDRTAFTAFIGALAERLHAAGLKLIISVPAKAEDNRDDDWSYPFDYASLAREADLLQLMTYDEHGPWSEPGPVSGLDWVEECVAYATSLVDPARLLIGLPAYGYDWDLATGDAASFSWRDVPALLGTPGAAEHWDSASSSPYLTYVERGHRHVAWFENAESVRAKTDVLDRYELAGLSMWSLGQEDAAFWEEASASTAVTSP